MIAIHDPIHGTIEVSREEIKLIDSRAFQRLRHIKQLGFSDMAFPGATHTRYSHSLGSMAMATRLVERVLKVIEMEESERLRLRQTVRLAVLFHDLGHPPMSHVSERVMPNLSTLGLDEWHLGKERQASHEDYTVKLLVDSELTTLIESYFAAMGISGKRLAALVMGVVPPGDESAFVVRGKNLLPLLSQIVSSEMDADRMDYLRRDAFYCGVSYGNFDHNWLCQNVTAVEHEGQWTMALHHKGVWAFENFLLARLHMFLSVYYHHTAICFDHLLGKYYESGEYKLPSDSAAYLATDDVDLLAAMRQSKNSFADLVVRRRPYRMLVETHDFGETPKDQELDAKLHEAGINFFRTRSKGILSKYFTKRDQIHPLFVLEKEMGRVSRIEEYTPLYRRFEDVVGVSRLYCPPEQYRDARKLIS